MRARLVILLGVAACGRFGFESRLGGELADGGDLADAPPIDAAVVPNVAFVTSTASTGALGGLAGADATCRMLASSAGLPGTYVAFLATATATASSRLGSASGWVRVDGAPIADTASSLVRQTLDAIDRDEHGNATTSMWAWTGIGIDATPEAIGPTCNDWTSAAGASSGYIADPVFDLPIGLGLGGGQACNLPASFYCFGIDRAAHLPPPGAPGRIAFVSTPIASGGGLAAFDARCAAEAAAAGLPGSYLAAVATSIASIASRFTMDGRVWTRVDGIPVADGGPTLFSGATLLRGFIDLLADGTYVANAYTFTGAADAVSPATSQNCTNWTSAASGAPVTLGRQEETAPSYWWNSAGSTCAPMQHLLCLQR